MSLPKFFGLDIGNTSIKIVQIKYSSGGIPQIEKASSIQTPAGAYGNSDDISKNKIAETIKELVSQLSLDTKNVITAVSERDVFSARVRFAYDDDKTLDESAYWAISKIIPVPIDTVRYAYLPLGLTTENGTKTMEALVLSVEKKISDQYAEILDKAGLIPLALETEGVALVRSISRILSSSLEHDSLVLDIGSNSTSLCIVKGQNLVYTTSIQTGSEAITRSIAQAFSLDIVQAEEYKKTYGIEEKFFEGKIAGVIKPILETILMDANRAIQFFRQDNVNSNITSIKLLGESSGMPGLVPYVTKYLGISAEVSDPLFGITEIKSAMDNKQAYAVAIGLALKNDFS
jgi:type IV pilus assembly protein PilM